MPSKSVYLGGIPPETTEDDVYKHLSIYGSIAAISVLQGYCFVEFQDEKDALDVVSTFSRQPFLGKAIKVQLAKSDRRTSTTSSRTNSSSPHEDRHFGRDRRDRRSSRDGHPYPRMRYPVIVNNIGRGICWQELKDFGRMAGDVVFCDLDKSKRGRGFIEYLDQESADRAVRDLDGRELNGCILSVRPGSSRSQESRRDYRQRSASPLSRSYGSARSSHRDYPTGQRDSGYRHFDYDDYGSGSYHSHSYEQMPFHRQMGDMNTYITDSRNPTYAEQPPRDYQGVLSQSLPSTTSATYSWPTSGFSGLGSGIGSNVQSPATIKNETSIPLGHYSSIAPVIDEWSHPDNYWYNPQYASATTGPTTYGVTQAN